MPLPNNEFSIPSRLETTSFQHGDQIDLHAATSDLSDLGDARDLVQISQASPDVISSPEFGFQEVMRIDEWLEWMRAEFSNANWNLRD